MGARRRGLRPNGGAGAFSAYNPSTGSYAHGSAVWGPDGASGNASWYNARTGVSGSTNQNSNAYGRWGSSTISGPNQTVHTQSQSNAQGSAGSFSSSSGAKGAGVTGAGGNSAGAVKTAGGNVYAGADGNVYKKTDRRLAEIRQRLVELGAEAGGAERERPAHGIGGAERDRVATHATSTQRGARIGRRCDRRPRRTRVERSRAGAATGRAAEGFGQLDSDHRGAHDGRATPAGSSARRAAAASPAARRRRIPALRRSPRQRVDGLGN